MYTANNMFAMTCIANNTDTIVSLPAKHTGNQTQAPHLGEDFTHFVVQILE